MKRRKTEKDFAATTDTILRSPDSDKKQRNYSKKGEDLSRDDLLFLLSVLEGELQVSIFFRFIINTQLLLPILRALLLSLM